MAVRDALVPAVLSAVRMDVPAVLHLAVQHGINLCGSSLTVEVHLGDKTRTLNILEQAVVSGSCKCLEAIITHPQWNLALPVDTLASPTCLDVDNISMWQDAAAVAVCADAVESLQWMLKQRLLSHEDVLRTRATSVFVPILQRAVRCNASRVLAWALHTVVPKAQHALTQADRHILLRTWCKSGTSDVSILHLLLSPADFETRFKPLNNTILDMVLDRMSVSRLQALLQSLSRKKGEEDLKQTPPLCGVFICPTLALIAHGCKHHYGTPTHMTMQLNRRACAQVLQAHNMLPWLLPTQEGGGRIEGAIARMHALLGPIAGGDTQQLLHPRDGGSFHNLFLVALAVGAVDVVQVLWDTHHAAIRMCTTRFAMTRSALRSRNPLLLRWMEDHELLTPTILPCRKTEAEQRRLHADGRSCRCAGCNSTVLLTTLQEHGSVVGCPRSFLDVLARWIKRHAVRQAWTDAQWDAYVNAKNRQKHTALELAVRSNNMMLVREMVAPGGRLFTPTWSAVLKPRLRHVLCYTTSIDALSVLFASLPHAMLREAMTCDCNCGDDGGDKEGEGECRQPKASVLHHAARMGSAALLAMAHRHGVWTMCDKVAHLAIRHDHLGVLRVIVRSSHTAALWAVDPHTGLTALHQLLVHKKRNDFLSVLLQYGVFLDADAAMRTAATLLASVQPLRMRRKARLDLCLSMLHVTTEVALKMLQPEGESQCAVCREREVYKLVPGAKHAPVVLGPCGHVFCSVCVRAWVHEQRKHTCPLCRSVIHNERWCKRQVPEV